MSDLPYSDKNKDKELENSINLSDSIYYIIETPIVDGPEVYTYNLDSNGNPLKNEIVFNKESRIYYSEIVSRDLKKGCPRFDIYKMKQIEGIKGSVNNEIPYIKSTNKTNSYIITEKSYNSNELLIFITKKLNYINLDLEIIKTCNESKTNKTTIPSDCQNTFQVSVNNEPINKIPLYQYSAMNNTSRQKHLHQQIKDLTNLTNTYNNIIKFINSKKQNIKLNTTAIKKIEDDNLKIRSELDEKLAEIYEHKDSRIVESEHNLGKSVYTTVVITILATSLIYFTFAKL